MQIETVKNAIKEIEGEFSPDKPEPELSPKNKKKKTEPLISKITKDNRIIETVCNQEEEKTGFVIYESGQIEYSDLVMIDKKPFYPIGHD